MVSKLHISSWLGIEKIDKTTINALDINYIKEITTSTTSVNELISNIMKSAWEDLTYLSKVCEYIGWNRTGSYFAGIAPGDMRARRGEFGEAIMYAILEDLFYFKIPIRKLRYKMSAGQSLPGTDIIAVKQKSGRIVEVSFIECKTRTYNDESAAIHAYEQLINCQLQEFPDIVRFTAERLNEKGDPLADSFFSYMIDRSASTELESFRIGLIFDSAAWGENVLRNFANGIDHSKLKRASMDVVKISNLKNRIDDVFGNLGVKVDEDD